MLCALSVNLCWDSYLPLMFCYFLLFDIVARLKVNLALAKMAISSGDVLRTPSATLLENSVVWYKIWPFINGFDIISR